MAKEGFRIEGLGAARYVLKFDSLSDAAAPPPRIIDLRAAKGHELSVGVAEFARPMEGVVEVSGDDGAPLAGAAVRVFRRGVDGVLRTALPDSARFDRLITDKSGRVRIPVLHPQLRYSVQAGFTPARGDPLVVSEGDWSPRGKLELRLRGVRTSKDD